MLKSGSICLSFLYKYLTSETEIPQNEDKDNKRSSKLKLLSGVFSSYGGILAKVSQILNTDDYNNNVFSECKPYNRNDTIEYLRGEYLNSENADFFGPIVSIDFEPFKSGTVGQVHCCKLKDGRDIILKVQYVGLEEQFNTDIYLLDKITSYLFYFSDFSNTLTYIKTKLYDELDYKLEVENQQLMCSLWNNKTNTYIRIPEIIPELCNDVMIGMEYIEAESMAEFITTSDTYLKNHIGRLLVEFIFVNLFQYNILYSDIHFGQLLIKNKEYLYITDFGCLHRLEDSLVLNLKRLYISILNKNEEDFFNVVYDLGIITPTISDDSAKYCYTYFCAQFEPWTNLYFEFTEEWLEASIYKNIELMKEWVLPSNLVYLHKIPFGAYHIFTKLNLRGSFSIIFKEMLGLEI